MTELDLFERAERLDALLNRKPEPPTDAFPAQWRANSETDVWYDERELMTREEINRGNGFYGWTKFRLTP